MIAVIGCLVVKLTEHTAISWKICTTFNFVDVMWR